MADWRGATVGIDGRGATTGAACDFAPLRSCAIDDLEELVFAELDFEELDFLPVLALDNGLYAALLVAEAAFPVVALDSGLYAVLVLALGRGLLLAPVGLLSVFLDDFAGALYFAAFASNALRTSFCFAVCDPLSLPPPNPASFGCAITVFRSP